ncbi:MAG: hypothetical protein ACUZ8H_10355 [Candidatus Anammoxibacter sp.]
MTYGVTVRYHEESNGKTFNYKQYREFKNVGRAVKTWAGSFEPFFKVDSVTVKNTQNETVTFNWKG